MRRKQSSRRRGRVDVIVQQQKQQHHQHQHQAGSETGMRNLSTFSTTITTVDIEKKTRDNVTRGGGGYCRYTVPHRPSRTPSSIFSKFEKTHCAVLSERAFYRRASIRRDIVPTRQVLVSLLVLVAVKQFQRHLELQR